MPNELNLTNYSSMINEADLIHYLYDGTKNDTIRWTLKLNSTMSDAEVTAKINKNDSISIDGIHSENYSIKISENSLFKLDGMSYGSELDIKLNDISKEFINLIDLIDSKVNLKAINEYQELVKNTYTRFLGKLEKVVSGTER